MNNFFHKTDFRLQKVVKISFVYNKVYLIKATSNTLLSLQKTSKYKNCLNLKKTAFHILDFHHAFQIACVHISIAV